MTIAALQPLKPMPFRIVYILGLGEANFPGSNVLSGLDLRGLKSLPGDIRPAEFNRYLFLETLQAVRDKVYLLYNCLDIQKDQILHPAVPLQQLKRYLSEQVLDQEFVETRIPLLANDECYLRNSQQESGVRGQDDTLVRFDESDRLLALVSAERDGGLLLSPAQQSELQRRIKQRQTEFSLNAGPGDRQSRPVTVSLRDLSRYLVFPVPAALQHHLRLQDKEQEELAEDEPFVSDHATADGLMRAMLDWVVHGSVQLGVDHVLSTWRQRFGAMYNEWSLRGRVPEEAFGQVDRTAIKRDLEVRVDTLGKFLRSAGRSPIAARFCSEKAIRRSGPGNVFRP